MMANLEMGMSQLKELRCTRCGSNMLRRGKISSRIENSIPYFEQLLTCKECNHEILMQVRI